MDTPSRAQAQAASLASAEAAHRAPLVTGVIRDSAEWDRLAPEWNALFDVSPTASPPLRWEWLRHWWSLYGDAYGASHRSLHILTVRRAGRLVGVLPLYRARRRPPLLPYVQLRFLSTGEAELEETCPDYLDLLAAPGEEAACAGAVRSMLIERPGFAWDEIDVPDLPERSPLLAWRGRPPQGYLLSITPRGVCPIADIEGGLEAYLERLPSRKRGQPRRLLRDVEKCGATLELARQPAEIDRFYEELIHLHQVRWTAVGKPGCFAAPRFVELHRRLARAWIPDGRAELCRLRVEGRTLAVIYGFRVADKFDFYQSGVAADPSKHLRSPGVAAHLLAMGRLAERGVKRYDFLRNSSSYKERLATDEAPLQSLRLQRDGVRTWAHDAALIAPRIARAGLRFVRSRLHRKPGD